MHKCANSWPQRPEIGQDYYSQSSNFHFKNTELNLTAIWLHTPRAGRQSRFNPGAFLIIAFLVPYWYPRSIHTAEFKSSESLGIIIVVVLPLADASDEHVFWTVDWFTPGYRRVSRVGWRGGEVGENVARGLTPEQDRITLPIEIFWHVITLTWSYLSWACGSKDDQ